MPHSYVGELQQVVKNLFDLLDQEHKKLVHEDTVEDCLQCAALDHYERRYLWLLPRR
jgi:hypothetical protein